MKGERPPSRGFITSREAHGSHHRDAGRSAKVRGAASIWGKLEAIGEQGEQEGESSLLTRGSISAQPAREVAGVKAA